MYVVDSVLESHLCSMDEGFYGGYPQVGVGGVVDIRPLKGWVSRGLSASPYLRSLILSDRDVLSVEEFLVKIELWGRLLREESGSKRKFYEK